MHQVQLMKLKHLPLSHSRSGGGEKGGRGGACHGPDPLQKGPHASRMGWVDVVGTSACWRVQRAAKKKMLPTCRLVVASAVRTHWRLVVGCGEGSWPEADSDALASGPAKSPECLRIGVSSQGAICGWVRVAFVAGLKLLLPRPLFIPSGQRWPP